MKEVTYYTIGRLGKMEICFPDDKVCCKNCDRAYADGLGRMKCDLLHELIFEPHTTPERCPIEFTGEIRGRKE